MGSNAAHSGLLLIGILVSAALLPVVVRADDDPDDEPISAMDDMPDVPVLQYTTPDLDQEDLPYKLYEHFDDELLFNKRWIRSQATKSDSEEFQYDGEWDLVPSHVRVPGESLFWFSDT